ncbi:type IV toxin-antitoxin system AbiEi family antitoxin domain-containing protein [Gordonia iterans]|nr:type IV toxin-antitoxin system AbiEi family antitoxin domain-containing protein [Gordonia iterans]
MRPTRMSNDDDDRPEAARARPNAPKLRSILASQEGVVTLVQTRACGLHRSAVARKCASGEWERIGPSVYRATDHRLTVRARIRAAVWSAGPRAVLSGPAAAFWRGMSTDPPTTIHVTVPRHRGSRKTFATSLGPVTLWYRDLDPVDRTTVRNLATTSAALTVLDTVALQGIEFLDRVLQSKAVDLPMLIAADARYPRRRGAQAVSAMLDHAAAGARSAAERRALAVMLDDADLPPFELNYPAVGSYEVDVAFVEQRIAVEIDGFAFHSDAHAFQRDRTRGNALSAAGWTVLHFTWADIVERPRETVAMIRWHLALAERRNA